VPFRDETFGRALAKTPLSRGDHGAGRREDCPNLLQIGSTNGMASFPPNGRRIRRERATIAAMIRIYCRKNHAGGKGVCEDCQALLDYAMCRLDRCVFGEEKPTCAQCPVHCYKPAMRERVREVMRFSGPWMILYHPILTLFHFWDGRKKAPQDHPLVRKLSR